MYNLHAMKIEKELQNNKAKEYSFSDIAYYANRILEQRSKSILAKVDVIEIAQYFGFKVFYEPLNLDQEDVEYMLIGKKKIIKLGSNMEYKLKRLIIVWDLGCYLFDYLGSESQSNNEYYYVQYLSQDMNSMKAKNAYQFAMEILMPREQFLQEYYSTKREPKESFIQLEYLSNLFEVPEKCIKDRVKQIC